MPKRQTCKYCSSKGNIVRSKVLYKNSLKLIFFFLVSVIGGHNHSFFMFSTCSNTSEVLQKIKVNTVTVFGSMSFEHITEMTFIH